MKSLSLASPHAIVMVGIAGSGKSFFAEKFASTFSAPLLRIEDFFDACTDDEQAVHLYSTVLKEIAKTKQSVLLELDSHTRTNRLEITKELRKLGYEPLFIWVQTDPTTAKRRTLRENKRSAEYFDDSVKRFSVPHETERAVVISGKHTYATQARAVLQRIAGERTHVTTQPPRAPRRNTLKVQ